MQHLRTAEEQCEDLRHFLAPHLDSFNWAVTEGFERLPLWLRPQEISRPDSPILKMRVTKITLDKPYDSRGKAIYPSQCRLDGTTYAGNLQLKVVAQFGDLAPHEYTINCEGCPIMVNSILCHLHGLTPAQKAEHLEEMTETGAYFIATGHEKIMRLLVLNRANYVFALERGSFPKRGANFSNMATAIRSVAPDCSSVTTNLHYLTNGDMRVMIPIQRRMYFIPLPIVLHALVECSDKDIYLAITEGKDDHFVNDRVLACLTYAHDYHLYTKAQARDFIGNNFSAGRGQIGAPEHYTRDQICQLILDRYLFPHLTGKPASAKYNLLIFMAKRLLQMVQGKVRPDNMDAATMHELLTPGPLYLAVISDAITDFLRATGSMLLRDSTADLSDYDKIGVTLRRASQGITARMHHLFSVGSLRSNSTLGLSQVDGLTVIPERINYMRYLAHFRSVHRGMFFTTMKTTAVRKLLPESWGFMCPVHTPDGGLCGLLNHLARYCEVVAGTPPGADVARAILMQHGMAPYITDGIPCIVDGEVLGSIPELLADNAVAALRTARRDSVISPFSEIVILPSGGFTRSIYVFTTSQRMMRPVYNCTEKKQEFIGPLEQIFYEISAKPYKEGVTTQPFAEIHSTSMLSLVASLTPFSEYNQSPRNMYQCQMAKQTMGVPSNSESVRTENKTYHVHYPQRPIVCNDTQDTCGLLDFPQGTNACVAVLSYTGYDMEDALILNKGSVERGFGRGCIYKTHRYTAEELLHGGVFNNSRDGQIIDSDLDAMGFPHLGTKVTKGSKILRIVNVKEQKEKYMRYKDGEDGFVDQVIANGDENGQITNVVIKFRMDRTPVIGDKFSSRHGQKGVFSLPWPDENMPFNEQGMRPDVIINPHAFPSRMTIAMLVESMCGKVKATEDCSLFDATPFRHGEGDDERITKEVGEMLIKHGYSYYGNDLLYSGITGEPFKVEIFYGLVYYQRLRHMVSDKYQVRATGRLNNITRQPLKGRKKGGGIRLGEMERDGLLGQGVISLLRDRFMYCSDGYLAHLCKHCGSFMFTQETKNEHDQATYTCSCCKKSDAIVVVHIPYVLKYLTAELAAMNIKMTFTV